MMNKKKPYDLGSLKTVPCEEMFSRLDYKEVFASDDDLSNHPLPFLNFDSSKSHVNSYDKIAMSGPYGT